MRRAITLTAIGFVAAATTGLLATSALAETNGPDPATTQVSTTWQGPYGNGNGNSNGNGNGDGTCDGTCDGTPERTQARDRDASGDHDQIRDRLRDGSCTTDS